MNRLYGIYDRADKNTLEFIYNGRRYKKKEMDACIEDLESSLKLILDDFSNKRVYVDIKNRFTFVTVFLTLKKMDVSIVLIPIEINPDIFYEEGVLYLTDNKTHEKALMINDELEIVVGDEFSTDKISNYDNRYDFYLFTSGSTGKSKLIGKNPGNIITEAVELYRLFNPSNKDVFYSTAPLYHIYGFLFGLILPLYSSAVIDCEFHFSPETIADYVKSNKIDFFASIPSYYRMFERLELIDSFKKVHHFFSSSAPLPLDISEKFYKKSLKICEIYGSTETGGIAHRVAAVNPQWTLFSYVKILNHEIEDPVEFVIDSPAISVDYDDEQGFNTGDVVQFTDQSNFSLLGRNTRFIKVHGKRVDLGFVLSNYREYVRTTYSQILTDEQLYVGAMEEKIYILSEKELPADIHKIMDDLKKILPGYCVPRHILNMEIPRNSMGKINKLKIDEIINSL